MNYRRAYMQIISAAKNQVKLGLRPKTKYYQQKDFPNQTFEFHHILPKSLFPNWGARKSNIVPLTAREHFFCHQLLYKIYNCSEMQIAIFMMSHRMGKKISSKLYEECKETIKLHNRKPRSKESIERWKEHHKEAWNRFKNSEAFEAYRKQRSELSKRMWMERSETEKRDIGEKISKMNKGRKYTEEQRLANSKRMKEYFKTHSGTFNGKKHTEDCKRKNSEWHLTHHYQKETFDKIHEKCRGKKRTKEQLENLKNGQAKNFRQKEIMRVKGVLYKDYKAKGGLEVYNVWQKRYKGQDWIEIYKNWLEEPK